jgi:hypothetical protein
VRTTLRSDSEEPTLENPSTEIDAPNRVCDLKDNAEPRWKKSMTEVPAACADRPPATLTDEPARAKFLSESVEPRLRKSTMLILPPSFAPERKLKLDPRCAKLSTDARLLTLEWPTMDCVLPSRIADRRLSPEPKFEKFSTETALPNLANERREKLDAKLEQLSTEIFNADPTAATPTTDNPDPIRP